MPPALTYNFRSRLAMAKLAGLPVRIRRKAPPIPLYPFTDYFVGFDRVQAVTDVFGGQTREVLGKLRVGFTSAKYMYMGVSDSDGNLRVGTHHLKNSDFRTLYLDVIHELFHVEQYMKDREYFSLEHRRYLKNGFDTSLYFRSPIEIPAYKHAVQEAIRIGMTHDEIVEYLKMGPVDPVVFSRFLMDVGLSENLPPASAVKITVRINRGAKVPLYPFTDFFKGFERVAAVKALFDRQTTRTLNRLKVEFAGTPIRMIFRDEGDGHLLVGVPYLEAGDARLLYVDILICLNLLKRAGVEKPSPESGEKELIASCIPAVEEGRRTGLSDAELSDHLQTLRFTMTQKDFQKFMRGIGLTKVGGRGKG